MFGPDFWHKVKHSLLALKWCKSFLGRSPGCAENLFTLSGMSDECAGRGR